MVPAQTTSRTLPYCHNYTLEADQLSHVVVAHNAIDSGVSAIAGHTQQYRW